MSQRLYVLFCAGTLCCSLTTVMAVSMALFSLRFRSDEGNPTASSLREFLDEQVRSKRRHLNGYLRERC